MHSWTTETASLATLTRPLTLVSGLKKGPNSMFWKNQVICGSYGNGYLRPHSMGLNEAKIRWLGNFHYSWVGGCQRFWGGHRWGYTWHLAVPRNPFFTRLWQKTRKIIFDGLEKNLRPPLPMKNEPFFIARVPIFPLFTTMPNPVIQPHLREEFMSVNFRRPPFHIFSSWKIKCLKTP